MGVETLSRLNKNLFDKKLYDGPQASDEVLVNPNIELSFPQQVARALTILELIETTQEGRFKILNTDLFIEDIFGPEDSLDQINFYHLSKKNQLAANLISKAFNGEIDLINDFGINIERSEQEYDYPEQEVITQEAEIIDTLPATELITQEAERIVYVSTNKSNNQENTQPPKPFSSRALLRDKRAVPKHKKGGLVVGPGRYSSQNDIKRNEEALILQGQKQRPEYKA